MADKAIHADDRRPFSAAPISSCPRLKLSRSIVVSQSRQHDVQSKCEVIPVKESNLQIKASRMAGGTRRKTIVPSGGKGKNQTRNETKE